ncbi:MAG: dynamin family protein [Burkholderiales bacterium]
MTVSINQQFDRHGTWRLELTLRLKLLSEWMERNGLMDEALGARMRRLVAQMRSDKVMVAFVAEFSRGKSELINALFFSGYGRRIVPANVGRTTMCPTELGFEPGLAPCLRLLPIITRRHGRSLGEWRAKAEAWNTIALDVNDAEQLASALEKVSEVDRVPIDDARALGFWSDEYPADNPPEDASGYVEIPRWRHALINIAHPLLRQGLVILDTPGLNAIGAEPELTVNLIPQAHAVVFILAADAGVTRSDLSIWRDYLAGEPDQAHTRLAVLNKIDVLWDSLSSSEQIKQRIQQQVASTAHTLGLPTSQVLPVSAQKGLVAKINGDQAMLEQSCLPQLELALGNGILGRRRQVLRSTIAAGIGGLKVETARVLEVRRRDLAEQIIELRSLRGKNTGVIGAMLSRVEAEQRDFGKAEVAAAAVHSVHFKMIRELLDPLEPQALQQEMQRLVDALRKSGLKFGAGAVYADTFARLRARVARAMAQGAEIRAMLGAAMRSLNTEYGLSLQMPADPDLSRSTNDLALIERSHARHLSLTNALRLSRPEFAQQLIRALNLRLREVFEVLRGDLGLWSQSALAQVEAQLKERRESLARRVQAIDRIRGAAGSLDERIAELEASDAELDQIAARLEELTAYVVQPQGEAAEPRETERQAI